MNKNKEKILPHAEWPFVRGSRGPYTGPHETSLESTGLDDLIVTVVVPYGSGRCVSYLIICLQAAVRQTLSSLLCRQVYLIYQFEIVN